MLKLLFVITQAALTVAFLEASLVHCSWGHAYIYMSSLLHGQVIWNIRIVCFMCGLTFADMQFVTNFTRIKFQNSCLNKKTQKLHKLYFPTKQCKLNFHIINIHAQGYITLSKYIIGISSIGLPVGLWASKCVTNIL